MDNATPNANGRAFLTPSQLNALARDLLEGAFPLVWVHGELSGVSRPASGHLYFTLKDARAQVRCALFKPKSQLLRFRPVDGAQVMLRARLTVYEARGDYQLIVDHMEEAGEGAQIDLELRGGVGHLVIGDEFGQRRECFDALEQHAGGVFAPGAGDEPKEIRTPDGHVGAPCR
jgi:hypothetical protein